MKLIIVTRYLSSANTGFSNAANGLVDTLSAVGNVNRIGPEDLGKISKALYYLYSSRYMSYIFRRVGLSSIYLRLKSFLEDFLLALRLRRELVDYKEMDYVILETGLLPVCLLMNKNTVNRLGGRIGPRFHATEDCERFYYPAIGYRFNHFRNLIRWQLSLADFIFTTNPFHLEFVIERILSLNPYLLYDKSYAVIGNVCDRVPSSGTSESYEYDFVFCGKLNKPGVIQKGVTDLLEAFAGISGLTKPRLCIIGGGSELTMLKDDWSGLANVEFTGAIEREEVEKIIWRSKFVVMPSRFEGMSIFLLEALAQGKPLIISKDTGSSHLVVDGVTGFLTGVANVAEIQRVLTLAVTISDDAYKVMQKEVMARYENNYSLQATAKIAKSLLNG